MQRKSIKHFSQEAINVLVRFKTANRTASIKRAERGGDDDDDDDDDDEDDTEDYDDNDDDKEEIEDS